MGDQPTKPGESASTVSRDRRAVPRAGPLEANSRAFWSFSRNSVDRAELGRRMGARSAGPEHFWGARESTPFSA